MRSSQQCNAFLRWKANTRDAVFVRRQDQAGYGHPNIPSVECWRGGTPGPLGVVDEYVRLKLPNNAVAAAQLKP